MISNMLIPEETPEDENGEIAPSLTDEENSALISELFQGDEPIEPMFFANKGSVSEGESLTFSASLEGKYLLKVSNKRTSILILIRLISFLKEVY